MSEHQLHPSPEELTAFSLGQLPSQNATRIENHISECQPCCETLLGLSADDTFIALLQDTREPDDDLPLAPHDDVLVSDSRPESVVQSTLANHPRYEIVELIARGGMGGVFKAEHRLMERSVALKVINQELMCQPEAVERFHREVKTAARLSHPNIVTAYDAEQAGDVHFLVMEYVDGVDLARLVKQSGALPIPLACEYVRQAAIGLQFAHEQGMVHRDVKPHNLMVTEDGTVKILDFGLSSLATRSFSVEEDALPQRAELTSAGAIMGTPDFISPEQADDAHQADVRSDIYSLGATLYYLISGQAPFAEGSVMQKLKSHAEVEPEPISSIRIDVPDALADVIGRMMAKNPAERFQTPADVADALAPFVDTHRSDDAQQQSTRAAATVDSKWAGQFKSTSRVLWTIAILSFVPAWILLGNIDWFAGWPRHISLPVTTGILLAVAQGILIAVGAHAVREQQWHSRCVRAARLSLLPLSPWAWPMLGWAGLSSLRFLQRDDVKAAFATEPNAEGLSHWPRRILTATCFAGWLIASGIVIYLVTDSGTVEIKSIDDSVEVHIWSVPDGIRDTHRNPKMTFVDTVTGSKVIRLPSGAYKVSLADEESQFQLSQDGLTLSRGGEVIVELAKKGQQLGAIKSSTPVANDATRREFTAFIQARRGELTDQELQRVLDQHAPVLSEAEIDAARALTGLLSDLPDDAHQTLLQHGYLKWRFEALDVQRQSMVRTFLKDLLSQAETMGFPAGTGERAQEMLATADVGFAVLTVPDSTVQFVAWYLLMPHSPIPIMFPLTGASARVHNLMANRTLHQQLFALLEKPYSGLPIADSTAAASGRGNQSKRPVTRRWALNGIVDTNSLGMGLRLIPEGSFDMGTVPADVDRIEPDGDWFFADFVPSRREAETPQHRVNLRKPFYMATHEVTVAQFRRFVEATGYRTTADKEQQGYGWRNGEWQESSAFNWQNPGFQQADDHPVCNVSWDDAREFCRWLSKQEGVTYRLPTEAEWEYACRAGTTTQFSTGDDRSSLNGAANLADAALRQEESSVTWAVDWDDGFAGTAPVGSFAPNGFGLFDMHGNAWEWCQDVYDADWYETSPANDPHRRGSTGTHVFRGGGFDNWPGFLRSADRYSSHSPTLRSQWAGFRVVREVEEDTAEVQTP